MQCNIFAFNLCNTKELINLNFGVSLENTHVIANEDVQFSNLCDKDIDTNLPSKTCCKNYSITLNFKKLKVRKISTSFTTMSMD